VARLRAAYDKRRNLMVKQLMVEQLQGAFHRPVVSWAP